MKSLTSRSICGLFLVLAAALPAAAQDLGAQWVDRITRELQAETQPLAQPSQFTYGAVGGVIFVYDSNLFLTENNKIDDQVVVPFVRANAAYAEPQWTISADLEVDYKYYVETQDARADEERFMFKAGYSGSILGGSIVQLIRNESDPLDATFANRAERLVSDTIPRIYVDITPIVALEADGHIQIVRFQDNVLADNRDNENYDAALALVYKTQSAVDILLKGGLKLIHYNDGRDALGDPTAPPDTKAWYVVGGFRGEVRPDLYIEALIGYEHIQTEDFEFMTRPQRDGFSLNTMVASIWARLKAMERLSANVGYTRDMSFLGGVDPYQMVDSFIALVDYQAHEQVLVQARAQVNLANSSTGVHRTYTSVGVLATYKPIDHLVIDGGVTGRFGNITGDVATDVKYNDLVLQVGIGLAW